MPERQIVTRPDYFAMATNLTRQQSPGAITLREIAKRKVGAARFELMVAHLLERAEIPVALAQQADYPIDRFDLAEWAAFTVEGLISIAQGRR